MSTHWMAYSQRKADQQKTEDERRAQYRLDEHNRRSQLYADFLAELRSTVLTARLRNAMHASFWHEIEPSILADIQAAATSAEGAERVRLEALAEVVSKNPELIRSAARNHGDFAPPLDVMVTTQRLTALHARISLIAGADMAKAADNAHRFAVQVFFDLAATEVEEHGRRVEFGALTEAIDQVQIAGIYELRSLPYGDRQSFGGRQATARASD